MDNTPKIRADRLEERLKAVGLTERKASMLATGQPDTLRFMRTRGTMPSFSRMFKIARVLKASPKYLFGDQDVNDYEEKEEQILHATVFSDIAVREASSGARRVAVLGSHSLTGPVTDDAGEPDEATMTSLSGEVVGFVAAPHGYDYSKLLATYVTDLNMTPVFDQQIPVVFNMQIRPSFGEFGLIFFAGEVEGRPLKGSAFMLRRIIDETEQAVIVEQLNPVKKSSIPRDIVRSIAKVLTLRDYLMPPVAEKIPQMD